MGICLGVLSSTVAKNLFCIEVFPLILIAADLRPWSLATRLNIFEMVCWGLVRAAGS